MSGLAEQLADWPVGSAAAAVVGPDGTLDRAGPDAPFRWASVTKLLTALAVLRAVAEGAAELDEPAGPPGSTVRHLLAHTSGLTLHGRRALQRALRPAPRIAPGERRVYSNAGYEVLAELVEQRTGRPFRATLSRLVLAPLGLGDTVLEGSPAGGATGTITDLATLARELLAPRVLPAGAVEQLSTPAYPGLPGELPGFGRQEHNDWGLGAEIRDHKSPHWTSPDNSPRTFGHFGRAGGFLWVDPDAGLACVALSDRDFGPWAADRWPRLSTHVLAEY